MLKMAFSITKRIMDIVVASLGLIFVLLIFPFITLAIILDTSGPIIFKSTRIGLKEKPFTMYKFRTMVTDAPTKGPHFTAENDTRITKVGQILRKTSLEELPQLFNVLKGDMSLVGPRPDAAVQMSLYTEEERRLRHSIRPGITGWAQATMRNSGTMEERTALDLEYVQSASLLFDLKVLLLTVRQIFFQGSY
jgi:lipopolysaccharide/colanic/teichoic acid biosynthesis glycosyltransferase